MAESHHQKLQTSGVKLVSLGTMSNTVVDTYFPSFSQAHIFLSCTLAAFSPNFPTLCQQIHLCTNHVIIAVSYQHHRLNNCCCATEHIDPTRQFSQSRDIARNSSNRQLLMKCMIIAIALFMCSQILC